jgi:NAD(P)-dependent dehydrogenase (short-subunit alcohol dehydrogenase family)
MHPEIAELFSLQGKTALITGGASPLGLDAASVLAAAGANLILTSRSHEKAAKACQIINEKYGVKTWSYAFDHTNFAGVDQLGHWLEENGLVPDILINNAGGGSGQSESNLFKRDPSDIASSINTNLLGVIYCCKVVGAMMVKTGSGRIINIASIAGLVGRDRRIYEGTGMLGQPVDYAASKAGIIGFTRDLAALLGPSGVLVNCISPGGFTSEQRAHPDLFVERYGDRTPLGRLGRDGIDLKGAILYLASRASDYVTGQNLVVDGGFSIFK